MRTASDIESCGRLTVGIEGSFGTLHYPIVALDAARFAPEGNSNAQLRWLPMLDLLGRGFKPARSADLEDIVLKAQPADGTVQCRASAEGLVQLMVDNDLFWSRQFDPRDPEHALWLKAAQTRDVTIVSGDLYVRAVNRGDSANVEALLIAKAPTVWTR